MDVPYHERIQDPVFRCAVDLLDAGDASGLRIHLEQHPDLVRRRVTFEPGYFHTPSLLEFCAENPVRHDRLPATIVDVVNVILDAGPEPWSIHYTLGLVSSGRVARECGAQVPLINLLCDRGGDPNGAMLAALTHGEFAAVDALLRRGATLDLPAAAATGRVTAAGALLSSASPTARHQALAFAAQHGHAEIVRLLLDAGEDPSRYNPPNCHAHSTPLHQAVWAGHEEVVRLLVEHGAKLDVRDTVFHSTPLEWAEYGNQTRIAEFLRKLDS